MIIITGASKGIGKYLKEQFVGHGEEVIGTFNSTISVGQNMFKVDITNISEVKDFINTLELDNKKITLINCAGANYSALSHKADINSWSDIIDINLKGTFNLINTLLPAMRNNGFGRIINFSSVVAQMGIAGTSAYAASKSALWGMIKSIAVENAKYGITINNLNLGYFDVGMIKEVPQNYLNDIKAKIPSGNLGNPVDIYLAIQFLQQTVYANGTSIDLNGGLY